MKKILLIIMLLLMSIATAWAGNYETVNGEQKYGYWMDVNGQQGLVVCDPVTDEPIRDEGGRGEVWINNPEQVQTKGERAYLYAPNVWDPPMWRGTDGLMPLSAYSSLPENVEFVTPYGNELPDTWRWVIFKYQNNNDWPVTAHVEHGLRNCGEMYSGEKYFGPKETKYLRLKLDAKAPLSTLPITITNSHVVYNYDIGAPTAPTDYTHNPPAYDGTGITWSTSYYRGISVVTESKEDYKYRSKGLWTLVPGFKEVPVWTSEDDHWGSISFKTVPAWLWVSHPGIEGKRGDTVSLKDVPNAPYVMEGKMGAYTKELDESPHCGPYVKYAFTPFVAGKTKESVKKAQWLDYVAQKWPDRIEIETNYDSAKGCFYADQSKSQIIDWKAYSSDVSWAASEKQNQQSGYVYESDQNPLKIPDRYWGNTPLDGQDHFYSYDDSHIILNKDGMYYRPVTGSYVQIDDIKYSKNKISQTKCTYYSYVYNPGDTPVVYTSRGAQWHNEYPSDGAPFYLPAGKTVTIPPHQCVVLTGSYMTPQVKLITDKYGYTSVTGYSKAVPPEWKSEALCKVGAVAPIDKYYWAYRIDNVKNNVVAYDGGLFSGRHNESFRIDKSKASPLIDGSKLVDEKSMTQEEMSIFLKHCDADVRNKINEVLSYGYATWSINQDYNWKSGDDGGVWNTSKLIP